MHLPRTVYEALPYAYAAGGLALCAGSYAAPPALWADALLVTGAAAVVVGLVLLLRRRTWRDEAARYDSHSLDDSGAGARTSER